MLVRDLFGWLLVVYVWLRAFLTRDPGLGAIEDEPPHHGAGCVKVGVSPILVGFRAGVGREAFAQPSKSGQQYLLVVVLSVGPARGVFRSAQAWRFSLNLPVSGQPKPSFNLPKLHFTPAWQTYQHMSQQQLCSFSTGNTSC